MADAQVLSTCHSLRANEQQLRRPKKTYLHGHTPPLHRRPSEADTVRPFTAAALLLCHRLVEEGTHGGCVCAGRCVSGHGSGPAPPPVTLSPTDVPGDPGSTPRMRAGDGRRQPTPPMPGPLGAPRSHVMHTRQRRTDNGSVPAGVVVVCVCVCVCVCVRVCDGSTPYFSFRSLIQKRSSLAFGVICYF